MISKLNSFYIPLLIYLSIIINSIIKNYGLKSLYLVLLVIGMGLLFFDKTKFKKNNDFLLLYFYMFLFSIFLLLDVFIYSNNINYEYKGYLLYIMIFFYWILYFHKYSFEKFKRVLYKSVMYIYIIAFLGIVQFFESPNLFGLLNVNDSNALLWAVNKPFLEYMLFFRIPSIVGSPQVLGVLLALYFIVINSICKKNFIYYFGQFLIFVSGLLTGDKIFILIIILFLMYKSKYKLVMLLLIGSILIISINYTENIPIINRMINYNKIIKQESKDSRIERYKNVIFSSNIIIGNGFGSATFLRKDKKSIESYLFSILYEVGIIGFLFYIFLLLYAIMKSNNKILKYSKFIIFSMMLSMLVAPSFYSPVFFIFIGFLVGVILYTKRNIT